MEKLLLFKVKLFENGKLRTLKIHAGWPPNVKNVLKIPGATYAYIKEKGIMFIFQIIMVGPYPVVFSHYFVSDFNLKFVCESNESGVEACMNLTGKVRYELNDKKFITVTEGDHNLIVYNGVLNTAVFRDKCVETVDIHLERDILLKMSQIHPALHGQLALLDHKANGQLFSNSSGGSIMLCIQLYRLREALLADKAKYHSTIIIVEDYLNMFVENNLPKTKFKYSLEDIETLLKIESQIRECSKEERMLKDIFKDAHLSADKIREGLKFLTKMSPRDIRLDAVLTKIAVGIEAEAKIGGSYKTTLGDHASTLGFTSKYLGQKFKEKYGSSFSAFKIVAIKRFLDEKGC